MTTNRTKVVVVTHNKTYRFYKIISENLLKINQELHILGKEDGLLEISFSYTQKASEKLVNKCVLKDKESAGKLGHETHTPL